MNIRQLIVSVKQDAQQHIFTSAAKITEEQIVAASDNFVGSTNLPNLHNIASSANRFRQKTRPVDPQDLQFDVDDSAVPENFLQADVTVDGKRHIFFSTPCYWTTLRVQSAYL